MRSFNDKANPPPYLRMEVIGDCTLYQGDCVGVMKSFSPVDHVITDPPYSHHVHSKSRAGGKGDLVKDGYMASYSRAANLGFDAITEAQRSACAMEFARVAKRWVMAFSDIESCHLWRESFTQNGLDYVRTGIWQKLNATPQFTGDRPATAVEVLTIVHPKGRKKWNGGGKHGLWAVPIEINRSHTEKRQHTTQKPLRLMTALLTDFTDKGETILDPFMGSATTLVACAKMGRKGIGIELDEKYFEIACQRVRDAYAQPDMFIPIVATQQQSTFL
jgi:DNA modification methylase